MMNEKFTNNNHEEDIARELNRVADQTNVNAQFAAELEERLRNAHPPKSSRFAAAFQQVSPTLRWVALMVLLGLVLSWSIRTLIPAPQPGIDNTPTEPIVTTPTVAPNVLPEQSATPATREGGYDFRGAKLFLEQPLPDSPVQAHVYLLKKEDQAATQEQARALADRFGIQGEVYTEPDYIFNTTDYKFSDGKQSLTVYSQRFFSYVADMAKTSKISTNTPNADAEATIREFLQARGFDFPYRIFLSDFFDGYIVQPLAPDSLPMQYESYTMPSLIVMLDENGEVLRLDATLMEYDPTPLGEYGLITAQEALEKVLDDYAMTGKMEFVHSPGEEMRDWFRSYPDNQPVTAYGYITSFPAANAGKPPLVLFDGVPVIGNINGLESLDYSTFVRATGQYIIENGIRKLNVETWDRKVQEMPFSGTLSRQGDQIILTRDDGSGQQYALIDPPADPPLEIKAPDWLEVYGAIEDGRISWTFMRLFGNNTGGGGGGNGLGFYKLNLSGPPVAFPTPTPHPVPGEDGSEPVTYVIQEGDTLAAIAEYYGITPEKIIEANSWLKDEPVLTPGKTLMISTAQPDSQSTEYIVREGDTLGSIAFNFGVSIQELVQINGLSSDGLIFVGQKLVIPVAPITEQHVQDLRGTLSIAINNKSDGTSTKQYQLEVPQGNGMTFYTMEGSILGELDQYNQMPVLITGTINTQVKLVVESYRIPYPDLHFQILKGTQSTEQIDGQDVVVFTAEDGTRYVEFLLTNNIPNTVSITGYQGDLIQQEVLIIPDETYGGRPVAHIYQTSIVQEGAPEMQVQANQIHTYNEPDDPRMSSDYSSPNLTITQVELVYFVSNPYYQVNDPNYSERSPYLQPAWHLRGQYEDGSGFDVLIQALKEEFLIPELAPSAGMG